MITVEDAMGAGLLALLVGAVACFLVLVLGFVVSCELQPNIAELQEVLCERLSESSADYRDCLDEVR